MTSDNQCSFHAAMFKMEMKAVVVIMSLLCASQNSMSASFSVKNSSMLSSLVKNSPSVQQTMQCSESWCNGSLTCSEVYRDSCPPGLLCNDGVCECIDKYPSALTCNNVGLSLLIGNCATFDEESEAILVGHCVYGFQDDSSLYSAFPKINDSICKSYNRTGTLCGRCLPDHYPLAYSFNMTCIPCPHARWNWFRYIMAAYLPLTLFYLFILFFTINTTSNLFAVAFLCQLLLLPVLAQKMFIIIHNFSFVYIWIAKIFFSLHGIWNLDFFKPFYSDLCLGIDILPTLALGYVIAVYPLLLMIITYLLINLYDRNYKKKLFKPLRLFSHLGKNLNIKTSLIDAFSTFFFLSNGKFLNVSFALLSPVQLYHLHGDHYNHSMGLYYAADMEYFGSDHLPYGILAITVVCVFVILPTTILALYPFSFFQKFINLFPVRWCLLLRTFMDSFQGCYKDGTEPGTRDCRWFSSVFFIVRLLLFIADTMINFLDSMMVYVIILLIHTGLLVMFQPYKRSVSRLNMTNSLFLLLLILTIISAIGSVVSKIVLSSLHKPFIVFGAILVAIPIFYIVTVMSYSVYTYTRRIFDLYLIQRLKAWKKGYYCIQEPDDSLPDRIENSDVYPRGNLSDLSQLKPGSND